MIKLKNILLTEGDKFRARSKKSGKIVVFKSKENMEKAMKDGSAEPLGKDTGAKDDSGKPKGADLFKSKETKKVDTYDQYANIYFPDTDGKFGPKGKMISVSAWVAEKHPKNSPARQAWEKYKASGDDGSGKTKTKKKSTKSEPDYDEANFNLDKIFGDDQESIETFQDIEDNGTVEDMEEYIEEWGDSEMLDRYGIKSTEHVKGLAQKIMGESSTKKGTNFGMRLY